MTASGLLPSSREQRQVPLSVSPALEERLKTVGPEPPTGLQPHPAQPRNLCALETTEVCLLWQRTMTDTDKEAGKTMLKCSCISSMDFN